MQESMSVNSIWSRSWRSHRQDPPPQMEFDPKLTFNDATATSSWSIPGPSTSTRHPGGHDNPVVIAYCCRFSSCLTTSTHSFNTIKAIFAKLSQPTTRQQPEQASNHGRLPHLLPPCHWHHPSQHHHHLEASRCSSFQHLNLTTGQWRDRRQEPRFKPHHPQRRCSGRADREQREG